MSSVKKFNTPPTQDFWKLLFSPHEYTSLGIGTDLAPISSLLKNPSPEKELFCINPLDPSQDHDWEKNPLKYNRSKPRRADLNVTDYKNFLFEMDGPSLDEQYDIIQKCPLDFTSIVYSGGKSYHCIISISDYLGWEPHKWESIQYYKQLWKNIADVIDESAGAKVIDPSCKNPSRLSRLPNVPRAGEKFQDLLHLGGLLTMQKLRAAGVSTDLTLKEKTTFNLKETDTRLSNTIALRSALSPGLQIEIDYSKTWAAPTGMYPEIYRLTMWAIDDAAPPKEVLIQLFWEKCFPNLINIGYPRYKLEKAIHDAYREKRLG